MERTHKTCKIIVSFMVRITRDFGHTLIQDFCKHVTNLAVHSLNFSAICMLCLTVSAFVSCSENRKV